MNQYEVMYIIDPAVEEQQKTDLIARFSNLVEQNGGEIDRVDEWGKRRLAYTINDRTEGYYILMYIQAPADLPRELERNLQISDSILRYLVIRFEGALPTKREPLKPYTPKPVEPVKPVEAAAEGAEAVVAAVVVETPTETVVEAAEAVVEPAAEAVEAKAEDAKEEAVEAMADAIETAETEA